MSALQEDCKKGQKADLRLFMKIFWANLDYCYPKNAFE